CGGSDAFSGISGNPLAGLVTREIVRYGGSANLAETDELIGAEAYVLQKVRDLPTARKFLKFLDRFKAWTGWHGQSAEGNPSGGNLYRGLYNIYLKSLGAATKRDPETRLDYVIDYGERMIEPGYYFMDSPGNDLESVAGQVAAGCNMIFFVTGNGSITNFPFVPTIKIVTTSDRYRLLPNEMDVNAGAYLDGTPMSELGKATLQLTIDVASGLLSVGEKAAHAQVQIWRDWRQTGPLTNGAIKDTPLQFSHEPIAIRTDIAVPDIAFPAFRTQDGDGYTTEQVGLILPTSLCSGQIAKKCVEYLNEHQVGRNHGISRFVTLVHTEGCGASSGRELNDTLVGYLAHPSVRYGLLLEHGCEKTHNGYVRQLMTEKHLNPDDFGWASVQLDGGIQNVMQKMVGWFDQQLADSSDSPSIKVGLEALKLGLMTQGEVTDALALQLAILTRIIVAAGGSVVVSQADPLLASAAYLNDLGLVASPNPNLGYAQNIQTPGFYVMEISTYQWGEMLTGLGAAGVEIVLGHIQSQPMSGHPLVPVLQVTSDPQMIEQYGADMDGILTGLDTDWLHQLLDLIVATISHQHNPLLSQHGNTGFQITRGLLGVSL
ncbi:MAG TPA: UxaA family hydrolase, partial [Phototrophicaceae bacterium]|nr:UxaA family hydrolase [Phototrophicaceae bacterium]